MQALAARLTLWSTALTLLALGQPAWAQPRLADEPTLGLALPTSAWAGDADASSLTRNPGGLWLLAPGQHLELAVTSLAAEDARQAGAGVGVYSARVVELPFVPRLVFGVALEKLEAPTYIEPRPASPLRLSLASAFPLAPNLGVGLVLHHFFDEGGVLDGVDTFDLGASARWGAHLATGVVVRDLASPRVGGVPVQRRYGLELALRPLGTDRLELAVAAELGERRHDFDPRARVSVRVSDGLWLLGEAAAPTRWVFPADPMSADARAERDVRATLGVEVSWGRVGAKWWLTGGVNAGDSAARYVGTSALLRVSSERRPPVFGRGAHLARVELKGALSARELARVLVRLEALAKDPEVKGAVILIDEPELGYAVIQELRQQLAKLRAHKKKVFAFLASGATRDYYLGAAADKIYVDPGGGLALQGMAITSMYYKTAFETLGVAAQFEKIDEYKSAPETFTRSAASPEARAMRTWLLDSVYQRVVADLAGDRGVAPEKMATLFADGPYTPVSALKAGLIDAVAEPREADLLIAREMGASLPALDEAAPVRANAWASSQLAVIFVDGDIIGGKSQNLPLLNRRLTGGDTIAQAIAWARENASVKAIVLRVDSPGGVALASEIMSREVFRTRGRKPIVISMGDIAASGGYYAAAGGDVIFAQSSTLTGSIGIFTGKFDLSHLLDRLGTTWETERRGDHADMSSYLRPYTDDERKRVREQIQHQYDRFVHNVADGRRLTEANVDKVARGRVWTGEQALARGLVDKIGGLSDALAEAKRRAGVGDNDELEVVFLPYEPSTLAELVRSLGEEDPSDALGELPVVRHLLRYLPGSLLFAPTAVQARLPFSLDITD